MAEIEVFIGVTVTNDDGTTEKHSLSGKAPAKEIAQTTAVVGMKVLKQILADMKAKN